MTSLLKPKLCLKDIRVLTKELLRDIEIKCIILDVDDTILSKSSKLISLEIKQWVQDINRDIPIYILSNNFKSRVAPIADELGLPYISFACKPLPFKIKKVLRQRGLNPKNVCIIGDQIFTDIIAGNTAGIFTVYVDPLSSAETPVLKLKRKIEKAIKCNYEYYEYNSK